MHTHFRRLLQPYFHKSRIAALEPSVRESVVELLEPLLAAGGGDIAPALTYPLPARVLAAFLHLPDSAWGFLKDWSEELFENEEGRGNDPQKVQEASRRLYDYSAELVADRKANPLDPAEDPVTGLLLADGVTEDDVVQVLRLLLTAGHNSTTSALGICILAVARDPGGAAAPPRGAGADPLRRRRVHASRDAGDGDAALGGARHEPERANDRRGRPALPRLAVGQPRPATSGATTPTSASSTGARTRTSSSATACIGASATWSRCSSCA